MKGQWFRWQKSRCPALVSVLHSNFLNWKFYLLQVKLDWDWQVPFHLLGMGPSPSSLKLSDSGQIPVSSTPTIMSLSSAPVALVTSWGNPVKSHDLVVCSFFLSFGNTETTPSMPEHWNLIRLKRRLLFRNPRKEKKRFYLPTTCSSMLLWMDDAEKSTLGRSPM